MTLFLLAAAVLAQPAAAEEPPHEEPGYGRQMTVAEIERDLVGNSLVWGEADKKRVRHVAPDGSFRGGSPGLRWHLRDYDNLFCVDSGDPATSGCVQLLRAGDAITLRRKDGLIELTADLELGNALDP